MREIIIAPSLLAADMANLQSQIAQTEQGGAAYLHLDIMDGHFVPNISYGVPVVKAIRPHSRQVFDVHLMISEPDLYLADFKAAGADLLCVHVETCKHLHRTVQSIKALGCKAAVALCPATPLVSVEEILPDLDMVLLMSVNPGFGGQKFIPATLPKISRLRDMAAKQGLNLDIQVDGGIDAGNIAQVAAAGANIFVAGTSVFKAPDLAARVQELKALAQAAL